MKYQDGTEIRLRERVRVSNGDTGTVVASFDTGEFSEAYPQERWKGLKTGILVLTDKGALVRFDEAHPQKLVMKING